MNSQTILLAAATFAAGSAVTLFIVGSLKKEIDQQIDEKKTANSFQSTRKIKRNPSKKRDQKFWSERAAKLKTILQKHNRILDASNLNRRYRFYKNDIETIKSRFPELIDIVRVKTGRRGGVTKLIALKKTVDENFKFNYISQQLSQ